MPVPYTPAEKLTRADDLMSDVLDCFLWPSPKNSSIPSKRTIKFTSDYRRPRGLNINDFKQIIHSVSSNRPVKKLDRSNHPHSTVCINLPKNIPSLTDSSLSSSRLPAVIQHLSHAEPPRLGKHIGLYLQLFLPKSGIRFCETDRYDQRRQAPNTEPPSGNSQHASSRCSSPSTQSSSNPPRRSKIRVNELRDLLGSSQLTPDAATPSGSRRRSTRSRELDCPPSNLTHLAVFAARDYAPNDIIVGCEGSFADLTEEEDLKLRSNAHLPPQPHPSSGAAPRESTDFSHIVNSRGKFQVFCGPARFVNHDCDNNAVLLREGFTIKFKVTKPIKAGQEILTSYGMNYFGEKNCECMCATCERNGKGFYSQQEVNSAEPRGGDNESGSEQKISIKNEFEEPGPTTTGAPSLNTDTDLSSLLDSSDGTTTGASNTPALQPSPTVSYSTTPSHVRRQLGLASQHQPQSLLLKTDQRPNSRSSSTRRQRPIQPGQQDQLNTGRTAFVSPIKFLPTQDLTIPVLDALESGRVQPQIMSKFESQSAPPPAVPGPATQDGQVPLPVKRKTYWITTKQKQLGLVPWEADTRTPSNPLPYSPMTPSLLGPRRRESTEERVCPDLKRKVVTEPRPARLPMRSYWVSTKEKQLGIVPWESAATDGSPEPLSNQQPCPSSRSTRASRRASEGMDSVLGFPTAPRGSKLSYKIFEQDSHEAQLLRTAVGRELLGFRPRPAKKKKLNATVALEGDEENSGDCASETRPPPLEDQQGMALVEPFEELDTFLRSYPGEGSFGESNHGELRPVEEKTGELVVGKEALRGAKGPQPSPAGTPSTSCTCSTSDKTTTKTAPLRRRRRRRVVTLGGPPRRSLRATTRKAALSTTTLSDGPDQPHIPLPVQPLLLHRHLQLPTHPDMPSDNQSSPSVDSPSAPSHSLLVSSVG
ncbi:hypothetical protein VP01_3265g2 [Puccinia sorghi]|uniref:SET domain-containing protein n=1 Tax=Puccinia sorghi TaxID=27349 RepID=A0A0L6UXV0_9BASI|nr:hypothetical protein VP01_3265g2 [Puccinia sorghi]